MAVPLKIAPIAGALALCAGAAWAGLAATAPAWAGEAPAAYYPSLGYGQVPPWVYAQAPGHGQVAPSHDRALVYGDAPEGPPPGYAGGPAYGPDFGPGPDFAPDPGSYGPPDEQGYDTGWIERERSGPGYRSYSGSRMRTYEYDSGWRGSGWYEPDAGPPPPAGYSDGRRWRPWREPPPCPQVQPHPRHRFCPAAYHGELRFKTGFFLGSGGVGPAFIGRGGGGGRVYLVSGARAGASGSARAAAVARASVGARGACC